MHRHLLKAADMLFIIIAKTQTFVFILMVSCFCGRSSTLSVAWDESVWHRASSSNITSDASSKDSRLRWNRIGWSDSCQIWGKLLTRLRCVTTTIDISGIERSSRLKMLWYMTRSLAPDLRNHQKYPQKLCTQSRFAHFFLNVWYILDDICWFFMSRQFRIYMTKWGTEALRPSYSRPKLTFIITVRWSRNWSGLR